VLYDTCDGLEKLTIIRRITPTPAPNTAAPPAKCKPGRQASDRRRARDRRRREAWAERSRYRWQSSLHTPSIAEATSATAEPATTEPATPSKDAEDPQPTPHPAPPLRKRAKTLSEATRSSSRAAVLAKKRQIPQLDGCLLPPTSPPQPTSSPQAPLAPAPSPTSAAELPFLYFEPPDEPPSTSATPPKPAHTSAEPEQVLCKECRHNHHHIRFYHCSQCHMYPICSLPLQGVHENKRTYLAPRTHGLFIT
jgi:hypothetical protein